MSNKILMLKHYYLFTYSVSKEGNAVAGFHLNGFEGNASFIFK